MPLNDLSSQFLDFYTNTGLTPFVLFDKQYVLVHPMLINIASLPESKQQPLHTLESFGDIILTRIWTPDNKANFFSGALTDVEANGVFWGEKFYIYFYCDIESFTQLTESLGAVKIAEVLNAYFSSMVDILEQHQGIVTQFQGDAILATFNVPINDP